MRRPSRTHRAKTRRSPRIEGPVAVVGITGQVGRRVATRLGKLGVEVRGIARHPHDYTATRRIELVAADCRKPSEARRAIKGAAAVYLTLPLGLRTPLENQRQVAHNVIRAAADSRVRHIVMHTALHAKEGGTGARVIDEKGAIEAELKKSGVPFTLLRPGWFLDNLLAEKEALASGVVMMPIPPERRLGVVAARDIAKAAVGFLEAGPQNRGFDLHVLGGVDGPSLAEAATLALGQPIVFREARIKEFVGATPGHGPTQRLQRELYEYLRAHDFLGNPEDVRGALPTFRYTSVRRFIRERLAPAAAASTEGPAQTPWLLPTPEPAPAIRPAGEGPHPPGPPLPGPPPKQGTNRAS